MSRIRTGALALLTLPLLPAFPALAQTIQVAETAALDEIIVTGTRRTDRTIAESLAPIDVISADALAETGKPGLNEKLNSLLPSFNLPARVGSDASLIIRPTNLRGLSGDQTLVLVNGKRWHPSAVLNILGYTTYGTPVDLDLLPEGAIERIEVLRDGASAQYGSDAIAGVINFIPNRTKTGGRVTLSGGQYYKGDGTTGQVSANLGFSDDEGGFLSVDAEVRYHERSNRAQQNRGQLYPLLDANNNPVSTTVARYDTALLPAGLKFDPREATADRQSILNYGDPQSRSQSFLYNGEKPLGETVKVYSFGSYAHREARGWFNFRSPNSVNNIPAIYPNGFTPIIEIISDDTQLVAGAKGEGLLGFDWDISTAYGRNEAAYYVRNSLNASLGPTSQRDFYDGRLIFDQVTNNAELTRALDTGLFASPLTLTLGAEYRWEKYAIEAGELNSYILGSYRPSSGPNAGAQPSGGSQVFSGFRPSEAGSLDRDSVSLYADLEGDITKEWQLGLAGRWEKYSDFGDTLNGKLSSRYAFSDKLALRGTVSTGFRAPALAQSLYASSTTIFRSNNGVLSPLDIKALPVDSPAARALGAQPLDPEKSVSVSAGLVVTPLDKLNITIDAYQVKIDDRIVSTGTLAGSVVSNIFAANGIDPTIAGGSYYTNAVDTRTRGLDLVADYPFDLGNGQTLRTGVAFNLNRTKVTGLKDTPAALKAAGLVLFDRQKQSYLTEATPRNKLILSANYKWEGFGASLRVTRFGRVWQRDASNPALDDSVDPRWITDLTLSQRITDNLSLEVGANNLFDIYPDRRQAANIPVNGFGGYNQLSPWGISGGYYYSRLTYSF